MKIVHWVHFDPKQWSGMYQRAIEIRDAEIRLGVTSGFVDPGIMFRKGYKLEGIEVFPLEWAKDADVHVIESHTPAQFGELKHTVFLAHGGPKYCMDGLFKGEDESFIPSVQMMQMCDMTIVQNIEYKKFWEEFAPGKIYHVRGGVDLKRWSPNGESAELFATRPAIVYMDMWRRMKLPTTLIFAMKRVVEKVPSARLNLLNIPNNQVVFWTRFLCKLNADWYVEQFRPGRITKPDMVYRSADILVDPCEGGSNSGVGAEALACGCPVVFLKGNPDTHGSAKCQDDPDDMAAAILDILKMNKTDAKVEARQLAETYYDVDRMVNEMLDLYEEVLVE